MATPLSHTYEDSSYQVKAQARRIALAQRLFPLLLSPLFLLRIGRISYDTDIPFDSKAHYIIAANHQSGLDPLVICSGLPNSWLKKLLPFRFFAHNFFFSRLSLGPFLRTFGAFPARHEPGAPGTGLPAATSFMEAGQTLVIFPEGRRSRRGEAKAHRGIEILAHEPGVMILPAHIEWTGRRKWQRRFRIHVGKPFDGSGMNAQEILASIYELPVK